MDVSDRKLAVVTGASSGIGFELAKVFGEEGFDQSFAEAIRQGYDALMAGKEKVVGGSVKSELQTAVAGVIPDKVKAEMHRKMAEPGSNE